MEPVTIALAVASVLSICVFGMILDAQTRLSNEQAVTSADAYSTEAYDTGTSTPARDIGSGEPMAVVVTVDVAAGADGGSFTNTFDFIAVNSPNTNLSSHIELCKRRVAASLLTAGAMVILPIPPGAVIHRYIGARYELGTDDTITVSAFIVPMTFIPKLRTYAKGYVID